MSDKSRNIDVARFVATQRAARTVASSAAGWWSRLTDAVDSVTDPQTLEVLYRDSLSTIGEVLGADSAALLLANEAQDELVARASIGLGQDTTVGLSIHAGEGMAGRVLASRTSMIVRDLSQITLASPALRDQGLRSVVAVPITSEKKVLGVLHVGSRDLDHFTEQDAELLEILADRLAVVLDRVRLFDYQRQLADMSAFLAETARIVAEASDLTTALDRLASAALPAMGDICLIDVLQEGMLRRLVARHRDRARQFLVDRLRTEFSPELSGTHPATRVLQSGEVSWSAHMSDEFLRTTTRNGAHYAITKALGFRSYLAVPIASRVEVVGTLTMVSCSRAFTVRDVEFAQLLAQQVGAVVVNAQQLDAVGRTSHILQTALLPRSLPHVPGLSAHSRYVAASQSLEVGGDFFDMARLGDGTVWFVIGDVEGHDRGAAALMGQLRSAARMLASQGRGPAQLIGDLQDSWEVMGFDRLATALAGRLDVSSGELTLASAGHYAPIVVEGDATSMLPVAPSPPLGSFGSSVSEWRGHLALGQILLMFTDGVVQERTIGIDDSLAELMQAVRGAPTPHSACERIVATHAVDRDDVALLAIQLTG